MPHRPVWQTQFLSWDALSSGESSLYQDNNNQPANSNIPIIYEVVLRYCRTNM